MQDLAYLDDDNAPESEKPDRNKKRRLLFVYVPSLMVAIILFGLIFGEHRGVSRLIDVVGTLGLNILAFAWCRYDSEERKYHLHPLFPYAVVIFGTFALLYYLFRSRGLRGGLVSTGWFVLYVVLSFAAAAIAATILALVLVLVGVVPPEIFNE